MNKCLILKWWWRILSADPSELWLRILKAMYFPSSSPLMVSGSGGSQFWRQLVKVEMILGLSLNFLWAMVRLLGFGWTGGLGMVSWRFPSLLFSLLLPFPQSPSWSSRLDSGTSVFWRSLSPEELDDWHRLVAIFHVLPESPDVVSWSHSSSGRFSVKSCYRQLVSGVPMSSFNFVWKARIPPKIKIFMWQAFVGGCRPWIKLGKEIGPAMSFFPLCPLTLIFWRCRWLGVSWAPTCFA